MNKSPPILPTPHIPLFLRQGLMYPGLLSNSLYTWGWWWTSDLPGSPFQVPGMDHLCLLGEHSTLGYTPSVTFVFLRTQSDDIRLVWGHWAKFSCLKDEKGEAENRISSPEIMCEFWSKDTILKGGTRERRWTGILWAHLLWWLSWTGWGKGALSHDLNQLHWAHTITLHR